MFHNILTSFFFVVSSVEGLHAIVVSDRDGVPVIKGKTVSHLLLSKNIFMSQ